VRPTEDWGPKKQSIRENWLACPEKTPALKSLKEYISKHHKALKKRFVKSDSSMCT